MKILITGAAGFIGSYLTKRLIKDGHEVWGVDDFSTGTKDNLLFSTLPENHFYPIRFSDSLLLQDIKKGKFDIVFHLAALPRVQYSIDFPVKTTEANILETVKLYEACVGNVKRVVYASSSSVYGNTEQFPTPIYTPKAPLSPYALQKSFCEDIGAQFSTLYGLDIINLRFFTVFGPRQMPNGSYATVICSWLNSINNKTPLKLEGDGEQTRDFTYIDNVIDICVLAGKSKEKFSGDCFNVGNGETHSLNEVLKFLELKYTFQVEKLPARKGDMKNSLADISGTKIMFGYIPAIKFFFGLEDTIKWWKDQVNIK